MRKCCLHFESPCVYRQFCNTKIRICCPICALMFRIILHTECIRIALDCLNRQIWFLKLLCFGFVHLVVPACTDVSEGPSVPIFRQSWTVHVSAELTRLLLPRYSVYPELIHPPWRWLQDVSTALLCIPWTDPSTLRMAAGRFSGTSENLIIQGCKLLTTQKRRKGHHWTTRSVKTWQLARTLPTPHRPTGLGTVDAICFLWGINWISHVISVGLSVPRVLSNVMIYLFTYSMEQSPSWEANWFCS